MTRLERICDPHEPWVVGVTILVVAGSIAASVLIWPYYESAVLQ